MVFVVGPRWFYGVDYIFELVSVIVGLLISYFSYKTYRYTSQKKYFYFSASFFLVALAFIAKVLATIPVYSKELKIETVGLVTVTQQVINRVSWINSLGISVSRLVMLFAFLILLLVTSKIRDKNIIFLLIYLMVISTTMVSAHYIVFHVTLLLLLAMLFLSFRKNWLKVKSLSAKMVMYSFGLLLLSQVLFVFSGLFDSFYVIGESIQLIGYLLLLASIIRIMLKK